MADHHPRPRRVPEGAVVAYVFAAYAAIIMAGLTWALARML